MRHVNVHSTKTIQHIIVFVRTLPCNIRHQRLVSCCYLTLDAHCCHMGIAKHPIQDRVKLSFVISDIRALLTLNPERQSARMSIITNAV